MVFVTVKLVGKDEARQGWLRRPGDEFITTQSGAQLNFEGRAVVVANPPEVSRDAFDKIVHGR